MNNWNNNDVKKNNLRKSPERTHDKTNELQKWARTKN